MQFLNKPRKASTFCASILVITTLMFSACGSSIGGWIVAGIFSPASGIMKMPRYYHTATLLLDGKVLVGGASAELYDPATDSFSPTGNTMTASRSGHSATRLPNDSVLVTAGLGISALASAEIYDSLMDNFSTTGAMATERYYHTATMLTSGKVLVAGGIDGLGTVLDRAELFR